MAMNHRAETIATPDSKVESPVRSNAWCRIRGFIGAPYLPVAVLAFVAVTASAVWLAIGGSWWFPVCLALSAVCMIAVLSCVYNCWIQRRTVHRSSHYKD
jgi:hypothetical protein